MAATIPQGRQSKKLQQFTDELNELCDRYQYQIKAILRYTAQGAIPILSVEDVPPVKKPRKKPTRKPKGRKKS